MYAKIPPMPTFSVMATLKKNRIAFLVLLALSLLMIGSSIAVDLETLSEGGVLSAALETIAGLTPGVKSLVAVIGFVVALIMLAALRNFGPVLSFIGLAIFAAVGLAVAGAIMGAVVP